MVEILWGCVGRSVEWSHLARKGSLNVIIQLANYYDIHLTAGEMYQLATMTFTCQLVKCTSWQKSKTQPS